MLASRAFSRLASNEDVNDTDWLGCDPAMRGSRDGYNLTNFLSTLALPDRPAPAA